MIIYLVLMPIGFVSQWQCEVERKMFFCTEVVWYLVTIPQYNVVLSEKLWST